MSNISHWVIYQTSKLIQWGWPSGWALDLKVAILGLTRSSLVQVQTPTLWKNSLSQRFTSLWVHPLWMVGNQKNKKENSGDTTFVHNSPTWRVVVGGGVTHHHPSTNHYSSRGRVVHIVMVVMALEPLKKKKKNL